MRLDDRLEITSPGALTSDMTIEKMKRGVSIPRNKAISEAFKYMGIIDKWGSGIPRMYEAAKEYGLRPPKLEDLGGIFRIEMYRPAEATDNKTNQSTNQSTKTGQAINQKTNQSTKPSQTTNQKTDNKTNQEANQSTKTGQPVIQIPAVDEKIRAGAKEESMSRPEDVSVKESELLQLLRETPTITQRECASRLGWKLDLIKYYFVSLQRRGILWRVGSRRFGSWEIAFKGGETDA